MSVGEEGGCEEGEDQEEGDGKAVTFSAKNNHPRKTVKQRWIHRLTVKAPLICYTTHIMLKIRLQRIGRRNNPSYRVVVVDSATAAKKGKPVELLGTYDTIRKTTSLNNERILYWLSTGAQVSDTMHNILIKNGVIEGVKVNALPKKSPVTKEKDADSDQEKAAENSTQTPDNTAEAEDKKVEASEQEKPKENPEEKPEEKNADTTTDDTDSSKKEAQQPTQDTPSAEG